MKNKLHVCIDARMVNSSGIGVVLVNYLFCLFNSGEFRVTLIGNSKILRSKFGPRFDYLIVEADYPVYSFKELFLLSFKIPKCDVYWSPHFNLPIFKIKATKIITTIHDTAHLSISKELNISKLKRFYIYLRMMNAVSKSFTITTVSNFAKAEILKYFPNALHKIQVIYNGIDREVFKPKAEQDQEIVLSISQRYPSEYLLFVGNVKPHKNLINLIKAFEMISNDFPNLLLIIVGKKEGFITGDSALLEYIETKSQLKDRIIFTGYVTEAELAVIYSNAFIFVFPSFYEGFGFPPLEAMASGCVVVGAKAASIPEICEDNILYFDPFSADSISRAIAKVYNDDNLRCQLIEKGLIQVRKFDWQDSGSQFNKLLIYSCYR